MQLGPLPDRPSLECAVRVYYYDTDAGGVVHNIAYLRFIEEARTKLAEHLGWSIDAMRIGPIAPVVVRTEIDYRRPAKLGDSLRLHATLTGLSRARFFIHVPVYRGEELLVDCRQTLACVDMTTGRPLPVPDAWRKQWPSLQQGTKD